VKKTKRDDCNIDRIQIESQQKIVLKKILGKKFKIIGAVTQLGIMSCDTGRWDEKQIRKK